MESRWPTLNVEDELKVGQPPPATAAEQEKLVPGARAARPADTTRVLSMDHLTQYNRPQGRPKHPTTHKLQAVTSFAMWISAENILSRL